jgi:extracellular elastinolytic metalloproteinase
VTFAKGDVEITPVAAIQSATPSLHIQSRATSSLSRITAKGLQVYDKTDVSHQDIPVSLAYVPVSKGVYQLAYKMQIESTSDGILYQSYVNATTGQHIANDKLTLRCTFDDHYLGRSHECVDHVMTTAAPPAAPAAPPVSGVGGTYRVLVPNAESPSHGLFDLLVGIEDPTASPFGWHDDNGVDGAEYTYTRGNNVHAFLDRNWDYNSDRNVDGGAGLVFDFPFNVDGNPTDNQDLAATNLFVRNNFMHDFTFGYGFNEIGGNFQALNYTNLGQGGDGVTAHAQFGDDNTVLCGTDTNGGTECINNADFSTPVDGFNGRMRMFVWNQDNSTKLLDILQPIDLAGKIITGLAQFGVDITTEPVTGPVEIVDDGTSDGSKGCNPLEGQDLTGKIAMIDRGLCDFSLKVWNAQEAGAIGAIVCNFEDAILQMGPGEMATEVTIPSVLVSSVECERIRLTAGSGLVASLVAQQQGGATFRDGSLDNGIIAHEYGHGISTRLTGGPGNSSCLGGGIGGNGEEAGGMGEGWSDFFALVTSAQAGDTGTKRRGIGTYAIKEGTNGRGIRTFPYTTDMSVNSHTYDDIVTEGLPHGVGSVWAAMLWDMYWAFSDEYGWDPDPINGTGGNNTAIQLVMDGLKLQPCQPSFTDARDAILLADTINNGGANSCLIWNVFARRGLGSNADAGDPHSRGDGTEGFDVPKSCLDEVRFTKEMTKEIKAGDNIEVTLKFVNYKDFALSNVAIEDPIPAGTSYVDGSGSLSPTVGSSLVWNIPSIAPDGELTITYLLKSNVNNHSIRLHYDDMEGTPEERYDVYYDEGGTFTNFWYPQDAIFKSGELAWSVGDVATESEHFLQNYEPYEITGDYPVYRFWHYFDTETGADGGFLEITTDDGESWTNLASRMFRNTYPRLLQYTTFAIPNLYAFSGLSDPNLQMIPVYVDLSDFVGEDVKIRYRFGTDDNTSGDGWYVDDIEIMDAIIYNSEACVSSDELSPICVEAPERGTIVDTEIVDAVEGDDKSFAFALMPNPANDVVQMIMSVAKGEPAHFAVFDLTGQLIQAGTWNLQEGVNQKVIHLQAMPAGMYVAQITTDSGMISEKFIKE